MFESTRGPKGGAFDEDKTSTRFVLGKGEVIPGLEEGIAGMKAGGVRQVVVPPEVISLPRRVVQRGERWGLSKHPSYSVPPSYRRRAFFVFHC